MNSIFATKNTPADQVAKLVEAGVEHMKADGSIDWKGMPASVRPDDVPGGTFPIKYSRAWLIVRRAYLEQKAPSLLVTLPSVDPAKCPDGMKLADYTKFVWSKVITQMRDAEALSWGEIMVRTGQVEGVVRGAYRATGAKKDIGLRINKGGRFAYGDPTLYLEHRKAQGAYIPPTIKGRPKVEQLLNATDPTTVAPKQVRAPRKPKTAKVA